MAADPRLEQAFPILTATQIDGLRAFGDEATIPAGDTAWEAGKPNVCMHVVLEGEMEIRDGRTGTVVATHRPGAFSGDIDVITGRPSVVTAVAKENLKVLKIASDCVRSIVSRQPILGEIILRAFLMRRLLLQEHGHVGVLVVGSRYSADVLRIREFLARSRYPMIWQDVESDPDAKQTLAEFNVEVEETPLVVLPGGQVMRNPKTVDLASALGVVHAVESNVYDVVVVGAGPAGLAAAVYGASEGLSTLVLDSEAPGGQAGTSSKIENYMGFPLGISGRDLADGAVAQAEKFGAQMLAPAPILSIKCAENGVHDLEVENVGQIHAKCVVLATGARYRELDVERRQEFEGRGIYYAATNVERVLCAESPVAVVGAGNSAGQAAVFMTDGGSHVTMVVRGGDLRKSMSEYLAARIEGLAERGRLTLMLDTEICAIQGAETLEAATFRNAKTGAAVDREIRAIFVMIGAIPCTDWLGDESKIARDGNGFVLTGNDVVKAGAWSQTRSPFLLETACPGVFAVGDVRSGSIKRVASAVGEGSMAIAMAHQYLAL